MSDLKPTTKKNLQHVFSEIGDRKLVLVGPGQLGAAQKVQDSRFLIAEVGVDHVVIKLLGEESLVLPFSSMTSLKVERTQLTITYR